MTARHLDFFRLDGRPKEEKEKAAVETPKGSPSVEKDVKDVKDVKEQVSKKEVLKPKKVVLSKEKEKPISKFAGIRKMFNRKSSGK